MRAEGGRGWKFRLGRSSGGSWCRRADDRKRWTRRRSGSSRVRRRTMSWLISRSSTSRTGRNAWVTCTLYVCLCVYVCTATGAPGCACTRRERYTHLRPRWQLKFKMYAREER
ncbi:hypothetical protein PUN28_013489 [Cardiocondyla obscurior]|uniref:Uncharacterized protein n=1 Tax=Cardiocondyla obscurior TaxID=286306 RepID=A0AAW2F443_9HYME